MAMCEVCGKSGMSGNNVSHSKRHTRTRWSANVHKANIQVEGVSKRVKICTRCLRSQYKIAAKR